jgi:hypothetical protein
MRSDARLDVAYDLLGRTASTGQLWGAAEASILKTFRKLASRRSHMVRYRRRSREAERDTADIARRLSAYAEALEDHGSREAERGAAMGRSYRIKAGRDVTIGDRTTIIGGALIMRPADLARAVVTALEDDQQIASLVHLVEHAPSISQVDASRIEECVRAELEGIAPSSSKLSRLKRLGADLSLRAGGSLVATAIVDGIKAAGHL